MTGTNSQIAPGKRLNAAPVFWTYQMRTKSPRTLKDSPGSRAATTSAFETWSAT